MKALLAALVVVLAVASPAGGAQADASYTDPAHDQSDPGALDITAVRVSNTPGTVTFQVTIANPEVAAGSFQFVVLAFFDLDRNPATGEDGDEARVFWERSLGLGFDRWNGAGLVDTPTTGMSASLSGGTFTLVMPRSALDSVASFGFQFATLNLPAPPGGFDSAPDLGQPYWVYDAAAAVALTASKPTGSPARPVAGRPFTVSMVVRRSDTGATVTSGAVACSARVGAARVKAAGGFGGGKARCVVRVPRSAKGKRLSGTITARAAGASVAKRYSFRVA